MAILIKGKNTKRDYDNDMKDLDDGTVMGMAMMMNMEAKKRGLADEHGNPTPKGMETLMKEMSKMLTK